MTEDGERLRNGEWRMGGGGTDGRMDQDKERDVYGVKEMYEALYIF